MSVWVFENHQSILRHHVFSLYGLVIRVPRCTFSFYHLNQMIIIWYYIETLCCCQKWQLAQILKSPRILGCWNVTCGQILHSCKSLPVLGCILPVIGQILCDSKSLPVLGWMGDLANRRRRFSQDLVKPYTSFIVDKDDYTKTFFPLKFPVDQQLIISVPVGIWCALYKS